jgi:hypothetical protein
MGQVRNDFDEVRVLPTFDYAGWEPGRVLEIPDADVYHYVAAGFTALTKYPVPRRLYPNHAGDELAYALPEPDPADPSAIAVGTPKPTATPAPAPAAAPSPAATAPTAASTPAPAPAAANAKE